MIVCFVCRDEVDRRLAHRVSQLLWKLGHRDAEFYVFGDHTWN